MLALEKPFVLHPAFEILEVLTEDAESSRAVVGPLLTAPICQGSKLDCRKAPNKRNHYKLRA